MSTSPNRDARQPIRFRRIRGVEICYYDAQFIVINWRQLRAKASKRQPPRAT